MAEPGSSSVTFERAADFYDATRGFPPGEETPIAALLARAGNLKPTDRLLEIGVGTGRIALPLAAHVRTLVGIDLAVPMMQRLIAKRTTERVLLAQADATRLPLAARAFDAAVAVHVFHLIPQWRNAVAELARVLKPGAVFINAWSWNENQPPWWDAWQAAVPRRVQSRFGIEYKSNPSFLSDLGWRPAGEEQVYTYASTQSPRQFMDQQCKRYYSHTWHLTDDELEAGLAAVRETLARNQIDLDAPVTLATGFHAQAWLPPE